LLAALHANGLSSAAVLECLVSDADPLPVPYRYAQARRTPAGWRYVLMERRPGARPRLCREVTDRADVVTFILRLA
jgi:hypothetical protein